MQQQKIEEVRDQIQKSTESLVRSEANRAERRANRRRSETVDADQHRAYKPKRRKMRR